jgi:hypothetical protein
MIAKQIRIRVLAVLLIASTLLVAAKKTSDLQSPDEKALATHISAQSLRGHVSFLSSDLLEGRDTPSRGLNIAAEYIAAQFRRIGLEEAGDDGYFQTATVPTTEQPKKGWQLAIRYAGKELTIPEDQITGIVSHAIDLKAAPVFKAARGAVFPADLNQTVILVDKDDRSLRRKLKQAKPAAIITVRSSKQPLEGKQFLPSKTDRIFSGNEDLAKLFDAMPAGRTQATVFLHAPAPVETPAVFRNVIGILRGSDPVLKDTYVFLTAHYDHLGVKPGSEGDRIYNGANDNASGTASLIEIAEALASLQPRPKRSIVFMTVAGEEKGLIGSEYYEKHPVFPIEKTVADINLEQLGRTDDLEGPRIGSASVTGLTYSDVGTVLREAGKKTGVKIHEDQKSDEYFERSDNLAFAKNGIPAHTVGVAYAFPDYHLVSDEWPKIDYTNMAKIDRMIATALLMLADNPVAPSWNAENAHTEEYRKAIHP